MTFNILVLTSDRSTGANFAKSLQLSKHDGDDLIIIGTSTHPFRANLTANDYTVLMDKEIESDPVRALAYVEQKLGVTIDFLYQTRSAEPMLRVSRNRDKLPVLLSPEDAIETFEDKFKTFDHLQKLGFPVPQTRILENPDNVRSAIQEIDCPEYWIRAAMGQGGAGAFVSNDANEIIERVEAEKGWGRFTIAEKLPVDANLTWQQRLSDNIHPGEMVNWLAFYDKGELVAAQTRKRLYFEHNDVTNGVVGYTGGVMSIQDDNIHQLSEAIIDSFGYEINGPIGIDYVADYQGNPKLTEVQASRFYTTTYFMSMMGLNYPRMLIDTFRGSTPDLENPINPVPAGMVWVQRFGADDTLRHRNEILSLIENGVVQNDPTSIMHRSVTPTTQEALDKTKTKQVVFNDPKLTL